MKFLLECLADLDKQFKKFGGPGMLLFRGDANKIFRKLRQELGITKICYEHDCEPIWNKRDRSLEMLCEELDIKIVERVSHTLWNPMDIIRTNGGKCKLQKIWNLFIFFFIFKVFHHSHIKCFCTR